MNILGIDPGLSGALSLIGDYGQPVFYDTPTLKLEKGRTYDVAAMRAMLADMRPTMTIIEKQQSMPGQGVASTFKIGLGYGIWLGLLAALELPHEIVHPRTWKAAMMRDMPKEKQASIVKACQLFPMAAGDLRRKKDDGRADALLIAAYGQRVLTARV